MLQATPQSVPQRRAGPSPASCTVGANDSRYSPSYGVETMSEQQWLTQAQFARAEGCDEKKVRRGLASGKLTARDDGKLDRAQVGSGWRRPRRDTKERPDTCSDIAPKKRPH